MSVNEQASDAGEEPYGPAAPIIHPESGGRREITKLGWPLAAGMLSFTVMGVVDTLFLGWVGTIAQAGVGLGTILIYALCGFFRGTTSGAQSVVSAAHGANDGARLRRAGGAAVLIALLSGLFAALICGLVALYVLPLLTDEAEVVASGRPYLLIRALGLPISLAGFGLMSALQGVGETRIRMWASTAGNLANIVLDVILIFGWGAIPALGESGAAIATVCGETIMLVMYIRCYLRVLGMPQIPGGEVIRSALTIGLPAGIQAAATSLAFTVISVVLAKMGAQHLAANHIALNVISLSFLPGAGLGEAAAILVGRYLGAGRPDLAQKSAASARQIALLVMGFCAVLFVVSGEHIAGLFTTDPLVKNLAAELLIYAALFQLFDAVAMVNLCALRAAGDTRFTLMATTTTGWLVLVPVSIYLGWMRGMGVSGAWIGILLELFALALVTAWRIRGLPGGQLGRLDLLLGHEGKGEPLKAPEP